MRKFIMAATVLALAAGSGPVYAAACKDAKGKFVKCPAPAKPTKCRLNGKFASCSATGAKPI